MAERWRRSGFAHPERPQETHVRVSYVVLAYTEFGRKRQHLVPLPRDAALKEGERVYLKVDESQGAIAKMQSQ